jgi:hypothetical protein
MVFVILLLASAHLTVDIDLQQQNLKVILGLCFRFNKMRMMQMKRFVQTPNPLVFILI